MRVDLSFRPVIAEKVIERTLDKNACTLCSRRISYKKEQFTASAPLKPYLILIHNNFLGPRAAFYNNTAENALFEKMIEAMLGFAPGEALVREILRCHFSADDTADPENAERCLLHVRKDIEAYGLRGILLVGQAASLIFRDKADLTQRQNQVFEWQGVRTMVCPGPNRLQFMREKNFAKDQIDAERQKIFETLKIFKDKIIGAP